MKYLYALTLLLVLPAFMFSELKAQGGANCAAAMAAPVAQNAIYNNQNLCNKDDDFNGVGIPVFNYAFNGKDWIYSFTATQSGYQKITIGNFAAPQGIRPFLGVFHNCPSNLNLIEYRAPGIPYWTPATGAALSITIPVYVGSSYSIVVDGHIPPPPTDDYYSNCFSFTLTMELTPFLVQNSCNNIGFEQGNLNNWMATTGQAIESFPGFTTPFYQIQNIGIGFDRHTIMSGGVDYYGGFPCVALGLGNNSLRLGNQFSGSQAEGVSRTFVVTTENSSFTYWYAVVFQDPNHEAWEQPFFKAMLKTPDGEVINCTEFVVSAAANLPGFFNSSVNNSVRYKPWSAVNIDLSNYLGQSVTIEFTTGDCSHGAHFGYAYIDCICAPSPFLESDNQICPGSSAQLTVPDGYTSYLWNPGNISAQTITVSPSVTTAYTVTVQSPNGCISEYYDTVFVAPNPVAAFNISPPGCAAPVSFTNTSTIPSGTINQTQWIINSSIQNTSNAQYQFPGSGTFPVTMMVTSDQGCVSSVTQNVTVPSCALNVQMDNAIVCSGGCATLQVNILDGQAPFQFNWQGINPNGSATQQVCPTNTTTYTVIVTDATGTSTSVSATVTVGAQVNVSAAANHITCSGLSNGSATANATGGTNITYTWSNGGTGNNISGLAAGAYTVTATNASGCQSTATVNITSPCPLEIIVNSTNSTCGLANGNIEISVSGGTSPYTYSVQGTGGPFTSSNIYNGLSVGNYTTVVQDANGCQAQSIVSVAATPFITGFQTNVTNPNCTGGNGSVVISNPATSQLFDIFLNGNQIQNNVALPFTIQNLNAGTFEIKLIDDNNCEVSQQIVLTAPTSPTSANFTITPATCGNTNGCVVVQNVTGGTAPYLYATNGGAFQASNSFCGLANGSIGIQIRDANLCVLDQNVTIAAPQGLTATATVLQHVSCAGLSDGTAQVTVNDGTAPFSYLWSNGNTTNQVSGLASGEHSVVVTDGNGCSNTFQITVNAPQSISFDVQTTATTCGNNNGTIILSNLNGGVGNLNISINGNTGNLLNENLASGAYNIIVSDENACTTIQNANITSTPFIQNIQTTSVNPTCANGNGSISITGANQTLLNADIYLNNNLQAAFSSFPYQFNDLDAGNYTIKIIDSNGCELEENISLTLPTPPTSANFDITPATCGNTNGCVVIQNVTGGTAPYQYAINGGAFQSSNSFCGLANGSVSIQIRDANLCVLDQNVTIAAPQGLTATATVLQHVSCAGISDGTVQVTVNDGTAPFSYLWSNGNTTNQVSGLAAGEHSVVVTDGNGCSNTFQITVNVPQSISFDVQTTATTCGNNNGTLILSNLNGGAGNLSISINGNTGSLINENLTSGAYNIIVSDENACTANQNANISATPFIQNIQTTSTNPTCANGNGSISITGANQNLLNAEIYLNNNLQAAFTAFPYQFNDLDAGNYTIKIFDNNGCEIIENISLTLPTPPTSANFTITPATCGNTNGCVVVQNVTGGTAPYLYAINGGAFQASNSFCGLANGSVSIQIRDANLCVFDQNINIIAAQGIDAAIQNVQQLSCFESNDGAASIVVNGGIAPFTYLWNTGATTAQISNLSAGDYQVTVTDNNGCSVDFNVEITQPEVITANLTFVNETCAASNASIQIENTNGGTGNYTYSLNGNSQASATFENLSAGNYNITIADDNQCSISFQQTIQSIGFAQQIDVSYTQPECELDNGSITINSIDFTGFNPVISINGSQSVALTLPFYHNNLPDNVYQISIRDDNQCELTESVDIQRLSAPSGINIALQAATCNLNNACLEVTQIQNGSAPYQYAINNGDFTFNPSFCNLAPEQVLLHVKDVNGCQTDTLVQLLAEIPVSAEVYLQQAVSCNGGSDGIVSVSIIQGRAPISLLWNNGISEAVNTGLAYGNYSVVVTDGNTCTTQLEVFVPQPEPLAASVEKIDATCNLNNGQINIVAVSGGVSPYAYQINQDVQINSSFYALAPSIYSVVLIDANSCQLNLGNELISMISYPEAIALEVLNASCGFPNGQIILNQVDGGVIPMNVQFSGNDYIYEGEPLVFSGLDEGNFSLLLTDQNGCTIQKDTALVNFQGPEFVESSVTPTTCNLDNGCIELGDVIGGNGTVQFSLNNSPFSIYPTFCSLASGDYILVLKDMLGCELPIELFVPATIPVSADAERIADVTCFGGNDGKAMSEAQVGTGPFLYNWSNGENTQYANALSAGEHTAFITDVYGCIDSSNVQIEEPLPLTVEALAGETTCAGDSVSLFASAQGGVGQINLFWLHNGSSNANVVVYPLETTNYSVQATDENNCVVINHIVQFVNPLPTINIVSDVEKACVPACINFMSIGNNAAISQFQWIINDTLSSSNPDPKFCFQSHGQINAFLMVTDTNGCKNTALAESIASLFPTPSVSFNYNPEQPNILNPTVQFNEQSNHAAFWQWDFGDGFYAYEPNPEYTFADTGKFEVCLQVSSLQGCTNTVCEDVYIKPVYTFYAPNAFTPNGDGYNDVFKLEGTYLKEVHLIVFNRWGERIFESYDLSKGWDGSYQGKIVQDDVYTWIATIVAFDKTTFRKEGSVKVLK